MTSTLHNEFGCPTSSFVDMSLQIFYDYVDVEEENLVNDLLPLVQRIDCGTYGTDKSG